MILSRVIEHFRKQHWTAIELDFVFVGMRINSLIAGAQAPRDMTKAGGEK